jgi:hypothetical protein
MWLENCIKKRRLIKFDKYLVDNDENQQPTGEFHERFFFISVDLSIFRRT